MKHKSHEQTIKCVLCRRPAVDESKSKEHIIPAALGGRRTVTGFICRTCNSDAGNTWDATLANSVEDPLQAPEYLTRTRTSPAEICTDVPGYSS